mmetsp:Transcript_18114/g.38252  ORF Transcript_18114/g.38252 Transcript_18114/m.38252 type:complete len:109 (+) Transcript_18114:315-641(+)
MHSQAGTDYTLSHPSSPLSKPRPTDAPAHSNRPRLLQALTSSLECRFRAEQMEKEENDDEDCPSADAKLHESPSLRSIPCLQLPRFTRGKLIQNYTCPQASYIICSAR